MVCVRVFFFCEMVGQYNQSKLHTVHQFVSTPDYPLNRLTSLAMSFGCGEEEEEEGRKKKKGDAKEQHFNLTTHL